MSHKRPLELNSPGGLSGTRSLELGATIVTFPLPWAIRLQAVCDGETRGGNYPAQPLACLWNPVTANWKDLKR